MENPLVRTLREQKLLTEEQIAQAMASEKETGWPLDKVLLSKGVLSEHDLLKAMSTGLGDKPHCAGVHFSLADIAVGCALGYLDFRFPHIDWRSDYPNLAKLQEKLMQRQSFIDSAPV